MPVPKPFLLLKRDQMLHQLQLLIRGRIRLLEHAELSMRLQQPHLLYRGAHRPELTPHHIPHLRLHHLPRPDALLYSKFLLQGEGKGRVCGPSQVLPAQRIPRGVGGARAILRLGCGAAATVYWDEQCR